MVYVSVAHPAPVMRDYIAARTEAEDAIRKARVNATILRPWYVLGPGGDGRWRLRRFTGCWRRSVHARIGAATGAGERGADDRDHGTGDRGSPSGVRVWEVPEIRLYGNMIRARSSSSVRTGTPSSWALASLVPASSPTTT